MKLTIDNRNAIEISLIGRLRILVSDEIMKEIQFKSMTQEKISLHGIDLIIDPDTYKNDICPTENLLTYFDAEIIFNDA